MPKPDLTALLGRTVEVVVDRPLGSRHPQFRELLYPVNYGEVRGTVSADGFPIDAYVLGAEGPVARVTGVVAAVVVREDDDEDKLVVFVPGFSATTEEIGGEIAFQEQYFRTRIVRLP